MGDDDADVVHFAAHNLPAHALRSHGKGRQVLRIARPGQHTLQWLCCTITLVLRWHPFSSLPRSSDTTSMWDAPPCSEDTP